MCSQKASCKNLSMLKLNGVDFFVALMFIVSLQLKHMSSNVMILFFPLGESLMMLFFGEHNDELHPLKLWLAFLM